MEFYQHYNIMKGTIKLKKEMTSKKFGVVFPANVELKCFVDDEMRIFAEHPKTSNVFMRVSEMNQTDFKPLEDGN